MPIIDLTLELHDNMSTHPAHARCVVLEFANHAFTAPRFQPPCRGFASKVLMFSDHIGTHVDAPFHYFPEKETIEAIPPDRLIGSAVCLDLSGKRPDEPITPGMLEAAEQRETSCSSAPGQGTTRTTVSFNVPVSMGRQPSGLSHAESRCWAVIWQRPTTRAT
jgi:kynurenine formamidase